MTKFFLFLALVVVIVSGCKPEEHVNPPKIIGERTNQQGMVTQRIILEFKYVIDRLPVITPDGPRRITHDKVNYFLDEGKMRRELPIMLSVNVKAKNYEKCWPVGDTNQWLAAGFDPIGNQDRLHFVLFDENRIIRNNVFEVISKWESESSPYELHDGNHTLILKTPEGLMRYDVLADKIIKIER